MVEDKEILKEWLDDICVLNQVQKSIDQDIEDLESDLGYIGQHENIEMQIQKLKQERVGCTAELWKYSHKIFGTLASNEEMICYLKDKLQKIYQKELMDELAKHCKNNTAEETLCESITIKIMNRSNKSKKNFLVFPKLCYFQDSVLQSWKQVDLIIASKVDCPYIEDVCITMSELKTLSVALVDLENAYVPANIRSLTSEITKIVKQHKNIKMPFTKLFEKPFPLDMQTYLEARKSNEEYNQKTIFYAVGVILKQRDNQLIQPLSSKYIRPTQCWKDDSMMGVQEIVTMRTGKRVPIYKCPECQISLMYTLGEKKIRDKYALCYIYGRAVPTKCLDCGEKLIRTDEYVIGKEGYRRLKYCSKCRCFYVPYELYANSAREWNSLNTREQLITFKAEIELMEEQIKQAQNKSEEKTADKESTLRIMPITFKDFVIRRNIFRCKNAGHNLQNITGIVRTMNNKGKIDDTHVPAGYCPVCNKYIIMESTYQALKSKGIILCRVSDEKSYLNLGEDLLFDASGMAQSSILKQCGYSVAQNSCLTSDGRKKILCMIIDNGILRSSEVISYLDWFIKTREGQANLRNAVEKWKSDLNYVREKYSESWNQYRINSIKR